MPGLSADGVDQALALLERHDVIAKDDESGVRFASELMRRWVADYRPTSDS